MLVHEAARPCRRFYQPWATKLRNALRKQTKCSNRLLTRETWNGGARGRCRADNIYFHAYWISVPSKDLFLRQKFTLHRQQNNARSPKCTNAWKSVCGCALVPSFNKGGEDDLLKHFEKLKNLLTPTGAPVNSVQLYFGWWYANGRKK